jgi:NADPH-dependent 2,4-dienoyl-CoA reductase/sulfur reductase-like enzyme/peroxiredoxin family protein/rhodanese-related sulfurtransferase/TusA-related sulfurtransferase
MPNKIVIVGGVAGGASTAARLRRLSEKDEIILLERGDYISYANCGLPYYIGGTIEERDNLFVMTPEKFKAWLNVDIRTKSEALAIDRENKQVAVINHLTGEKYFESYDYLVLSPGAEPLRPPLPGIDSEGIFSLRTVNDTDRIYSYMQQKCPKNVVVVGAGYIGLEMAENLHHRGLSVTIVELAPQVLPPIDQDMATLVQQYLTALKVKMRLGNGVKQFHRTASGPIEVELNDGERLKADLVILSIGVKPEVKLAADCNLEVSRGIVVNNRMQTSDSSIYALGDAVEVTHLVTGKAAVIPLAGPANKQGRIVANNIAGKDDIYRGTQGTSVLKLFDMTIATTGANERGLRDAGIAYYSVIVHPNSHASYYPGAKPVSLKLLFSPEGSILGAQAVGYEGVEKRIDVIATALRLKASVRDLTELELAYAPPFSSAKDPVNMAGFVASNYLSGDYDTIEAVELMNSLKSDQQLLDIRETEETELGLIPNAIHIPLGELRSRLNELDRSKEILTFCSVGLRSYFASRILKLNGFNRVRNLNGGYRMYSALKASEIIAQQRGDEETVSRDEQLIEATPANTSLAGTVKLDLCGLQCPGPIMQVFRKINEIPEGAILEVCATDPGFSSDIDSWCHRTGNTLLNKGHDGKGFTALIRKGNGLATENQVANALNNRPEIIENDKTIVIFSGDLDRALAALIIANGAASMGRKVTLFFTFWGLNILRKNETVKVKKPFMDGMFGKMMPRGSTKLGLSRMNMAGMGPKMIRMVMKNKNVDSLEKLLQEALKSGVHLVACQMSMDIMGITAAELIEGVELAGVASYLDAAESADVNLFI